jgi:hypothetical protein
MKYLTIFDYWQLFKIKIKNTRIFPILKYKIKWWYKFVNKKVNSYKLVLNHYIISGLNLTFDLKYQVVDDTEKIYLLIQIYIKIPFKGLYDKFISVFENAKQENSKLISRN